MWRSFFLPALLALGTAVVTLSSASSTTSTSINKTICTMPITDGGVDWSRMASHAFYATKYYAPKFPGIQWSAKYVNVYPGTSADMARGWVVNGSDCDALVGPGFSSRATTISPLVTVPWVDVSSSTELSNKKDHPTFSRTYPKDTVVAKAAGHIFKALQWNATNIICTDESHARSAANGVSAAVQGNGGLVDVSVCLERTATEEQVATVFDQFYSSKTRIIYSSALGVLHDKFAAECEKRNCTQDFTVFFIANYCPSKLENWPGALCAAVLVDTAAMGSFLEGYYARDVTQERKQLAALGWPADTDITTTGVYAQFAHDAAHHVMSAIHEYHMNNSCCVPDTDAPGDGMIEYVRNHISRGATGKIALDANGDRADVDVAVYNNNLTSQWNLVATIRDGVFDFVDPVTLTPVEIRPDLLLRGTQVTTHTDDIPSGEVPDNGDSSSVVIIVDSTALYIGISFGIFAALIVFVVLPVATFQVKNASGGQRDVSCAPKDSSQPIAIVFTDIQSSTSLWARIPQKMAEAVDTHHNIIRKLIRRHKGYEVKTIGDCFMVAFLDSKTAVDFAVNVQLDFYAHDWGPSFNGVGGTIDDVYFQLAQELIDREADASQVLMSAGDYGEVQNPLSGPSTKISAEANGGIGPWNGLRVRVGIHKGVGEIKFDDVSKGYDYFGTVVNTAARVEGVGNGGQILMTSSALEDALCRAEEGVLPNVAITNLGVQPLRGLDDPVPLHLIVPDSLKTREFAALRLDVEHTAQGDGAAEEGDPDMSGCSGSGASSVKSPWAGSSDANITPELLAGRFARRWKGVAAGGGLSRPEASTCKSSTFSKALLEAEDSVQDLLHDQSGDQKQPSSPRQRDSRNHHHQYGKNSPVANEIIKDGYKDIMWSYLVAKTMFSTSTDRVKRETLDHWASKWHVPLKKSRDKRVTPKMQWDRHLMQMILRVTPAAEAKLKENQRKEQSTAGWPGLPAGVVTMSNERDFMESASDPAGLVTDAAVAASNATVTLNAERSEDEHSASAVSPTLLEVFSAEEGEGEEE